MGCRRGFTILADTSRGFRYKASVPNTDQRSEFSAGCVEHITKDEKRQARFLSDTPSHGMLLGTG